jgi:hypothetical protein
MSTGIQSASVHLVASAYAIPPLIDKNLCACQQSRSGKSKSESQTVRRMTAELGHIMFRAIVALR